MLTLKADRRSRAMADAVIIASGLARGRRRHPRGECSDSRPKVRYESKFVGDSDEDLNLLHWALGMSFALPDAVRHRWWNFRLSTPWGVRGSVVHHQDHGDRAQWPGATVEDTTRQVTDRIEKKLEELQFTRLHPQPNHAGPDRHLCPPEGLRPRVATCRVSG